MKKYSEIKKLVSSYGINKIFCAGMTEIYRKIWLEFIRNSYAQKGEDMVVEKLFAKNYAGRYLEIGAYHPTRLSNTYRFYKKGWRGIVVEPNPNIKELFSKLRPRDKFYNIGISDKNQILNYYQFLIPALNTFSKKDADNNIKSGHKLDKVIKIQTKNIKEIIKGKIDFLSIDTEGFDEKILISWPWKQNKPKVICIETDKNYTINNLLIRKGYIKMFKNRFNSIFVLKKSEPGDGRRQ